MSSMVGNLALLIWPVVCAVLFNRLRIELALIWSILGGYLLLPPLVEFDLPLLPALDKFSIPSFSAFLIIVFVLGRRVSLLPENRLGKLLVLALVLNAVPTVLTNGDPMVFGAAAGMTGADAETTVIPGLKIRDLLSVFVKQMIMLLPFLMGRQLLASEQGMRDLLVALVIAALAYSVLALAEVRLSPQLNIWVYGFFQHSFAQMMRGDGFRPIVFLPHALWLALFMLCSLLAAAGLARHAPPETRGRFIIATVYLGVVLYLCKSLASQLYAVALLPIILLGGLRLQVLVALGFAALAVTYPVLRNLGLVPLDLILAQAEAISPDRAQSLGFRFQNEEMLLERAREKWLFGWGGWGRNLVRDDVTGDLITVPDGRWIITFGTYGWVGYLSEMGLLAMPVVLMWRASRAAADVALSPLAVTLVLILAITMVDMLLNDTLVPFTWMIAGAVLGYCERLELERLKMRGAGAVEGGQRVVIGQEDRDRGRRTIL
ncbi:hypothetical protein [Roseovarius sp. SYSU LYC5161]|uniref:hypothetical protein n=1 Tax=Roseovarius halophilus (ex Wu et al. 2025) TaxID=3376060 RepID=UPI003999800B